MHRVRHLDHGESDAGNFRPIGNGMRGEAMNNALAPHVVTATDAPTIRKWLHERGGIAVWRSVNLSNPGASWTTPVNDAHGEPTGRPNWQSAAEPERVIVSEEDVLVSVDKEVKRFHVAIRMASQSMMLKCTDGATRRIRREVAKAGDGAFYQFDYGSQEAVIMAPEKQVPLKDWSE